MDVRKILADAWQAVQESGVPEPMQAAAFGMAVNLIAGTQSPSGQTLPASQSELGNGQEPVDSGLERIAARLQLDAELVHEIYGIENGEPVVVISNRKIDQKKLTGTRQLAILVAAGRQAGIPEDSTPVRIIRQTAEDYKRLDQNNFSKAIQGLDDIVQIRGRNPNQTLKLSKPGWAEAARLANELVGSDN